MFTFCPIRLERVVEELGALAKKGSWDGVLLSLFATTNTYMRHD
jgi:hypothetical protein